MISEVKNMFSLGQDSFAPSVVNAGGVLVTAMCRGVAGRKWGFIEVISRRSTDGGTSWSEEKVVALPPARAITRDENNTKSAFFLNPVMAVAPNGDIVMLLTFFPESKGTADVKYLEKKKTAFTYFDGERCPIIYDRDGSYYIVMKDGAVIDKTKAKTAFTVKGIGELYKEDEYIGNIYLNGAKGKSETERVTTFGSMLKTPKRSYIFMCKSKDRGLTWSEPKDITPEILSENDGALVMTVPGSGLTTDKGRIIIPLYNEKNSISIYSDDNGETFSRNPRMPYTGGKGMWTAVQTPDGIIHAFNEGKCVVSDDNGIIWAKGSNAPHIKAKAQKSAVALNDKIFLTSKGVLAIADYTEDKKGNYKDFKWRKELTPLSDGYFGASCICAIDKTNLAVLFEGENDVEFSLISIE